MFIAVNDHKFGHSFRSAMSRATVARKRAMTFYEIVASYKLPAPPEQKEQNELHE